VAVRDDKPEAGAPAGRTHRVFAIEAGREEATAKAYAATSASATSATATSMRVKKGDRVKAGQFIGWTTKGSWHVHLTEFFFPATAGAADQPAPPGRKLRPYVDTAPPVIHDVRFFTPATPTWAGESPASRAAAAGQRLDKSRLTGIVDIRARQRPTVVPGLVPHVPCSPRASPYRIGPPDPAAQREGRAPAHRVHRRPGTTDLAGSALRAGTKQEPPRRAGPQTTDPGCRRILVPALPEAVLEHDACAERPPPSSSERGMLPTVPARHRNRDSNPPV
jgi:hypothetical protein